MKSYALLDHPKLPPILLDLFPEFSYFFVGVLATTAAAAAPRRVSRCNNTRLTRQTPFGCSRRMHRIGRVCAHVAATTVAGAPSAEYRENAAAVLAKVKAAKVVPVIVLDSADDAVPLAHALKAGGIPIMEITFRTAAAEACMLALKTANVEGVCVGAGTVLTVAQAEAAVNAGAEFIISPGVNPEVVSWCIERGVPVFPGIATPTDIQAAMNLGCDTLKFFPAEANGGVKTLSALASVFADVNFMPTGGITAGNIGGYLSLKPVVACGELRNSLKRCGNCCCLAVACLRFQVANPCRLLAGGTWMVKPDIIKAGKWEEITAMSRDAVKAASAVA
eukprot:COSAG05_NODE_806_length_7193_cov_10.079786_2_plen_335_part_00